MFYLKENEQVYLMKKMKVYAGPQASTCSVSQTQLAPLLHLHIQCNNLMEFDTKHFLKCHYIIAIDKHPL